MLSAPGMLPGTSEGTSMRAPSMTRPAAVRRLPLLLAGLLAIAGIGLAGSRDTAAGAAAPPLMVGVGRADITPPTGHYFQGWVESSALGTGVNTRIYARAIVLQEGSQKYALVAEDMNGTPAACCSTPSARSPTSASPRRTCWTRRATPTPPRAGTATTRRTTRSS